ncbi:MAG: hypothetical protein HYW01_02340 [Deltaproteobacteria bacterium]|nr:hypothetical protein [Deltaproteobacteria bacterium]
MPIQATLVLTLLILTSPIAALAFSVPQLLEDKDVVIVGETHRRPESTQFVTNTVAEYLQGGKCLIVGLEIPSHQQPVLERAFKKRVSISSISSIPLSSIIDHPGYRKMLASFRNQIREGKCLKVRAIDVPHIVSVDRDEWMEKQILEMMDGTPIVVLVGNFHAMKEVRWNSDPLGGPSLTERLIDRGIRVASMLQYWEKKGCNLRSEKLVSTEEPESSEYVKQIMEVINAEAPDKASEAADGVVVWRCVD